METDMIAKLLAKFHVWMLNGRSVVLLTDNYVPGLMELKSQMAK